MASLRSAITAGHGLPEQRAMPYPQMAGSSAAFRPQLSDDDYGLIPA